MSEYMYTVYIKQDTLDTLDTHTQRGAHRTLVTGHGTWANNFVLVGKENLRAKRQVAGQTAWEKAGGGRIGEGNGQTFYAFCLIKIATARGAGTAESGARAGAAGTGAVAFAGTAFFQLSWHCI